MQALFSDLFLQAFPFTSSFILFYTEAFQSLSNFDSARCVNYCKLCRCCSLLFDAFGYNSYVPKTQDIKSAGFYDANSNYQAKGSAVGKNLKDMADDITDKDTIANILKAHFQLVDNRNYSVKNKFKNTWISMFKDNVPVFSEISKIPITHLHTRLITVILSQEHTVQHRLLKKLRAIFQALITNLTHPTSFIQRAISRHTVRL